MEEKTYSEVKYGYDDVSYPKYYFQPGSVECIEEMIEVFGVNAVMNFCLLNVWKYRKRAIYKNKEQDIEKSNWYMHKYLELKKRKCCEGVKNEDY